MKARAAAHPIAAFARLAFTDLLAYRLRYVIGILNYIIYMAVQYFLWRAVYSSSPGVDAALGGFGFREIITYFAVGWIVRVSCFNNIDRELADRIAQGDIVLDLVRPVSVLERFYGEAVGEALFRVFFMGIPTAAVLFPLFSVGGPSLPPDLPGAMLQIAGFLASVVLAFHVFFAINFLVGACTVFFEKIRGLLWSKFILVQFLSGLMVPFDLFPGWARAILEVLPFRAILHGPLAIYLGRMRGEEILRELGLQAAWVLALHIGARWLWRRCRLRLQVHGG